MNTSKTILCILSFAHCTFSFAQQTGINAVLNGELSKIPVYHNYVVAAEQYFIIPCDFGKDSLRFNDSVNISQVQVTAVDLVFTDYPTANDLKELNGRRLHHLFNRYPQLMNRQGIEWKLVRQMDGTEREKAAGMFHGFVVYYRPLQNRETMNNDLKKLKIMLSPLPDSVRHVKKNAFLSADTTHLRERYEIEPYTIIKKLPAKEAILYIGMNEMDIKYYLGHDSLYVFEIPGEEGFPERVVLKNPDDSTVTKVFDRMSWKDMLVVTDVTASMYPYTGQLLVWMQLHEDERDIRQFIFFNDGDDLDEDKKIPGKTGGIYGTNSSVFEVVEETAFKAMSKGSGGGIPENNIEALLKGISTCADCRSVVMIADNSSPVSDMILLNQVNRPIHIILCGVHETLNPDYLAIARSTGGSVHLINEDLNSLAELKEGEKISIAGKTYIISKGKFILKK